MASVVFAWNPDGKWRIWYDCRGLNAITEPQVEQLPHIDAFLDEMRQRSDALRQVIYQVWPRARLPPSSAARLGGRLVEDTSRWERPSRSQLGQFEWKVMSFVLQGSSSVLMRGMNAATTRGLHEADLD